MVHQFKEEWEKVQISYADVPGLEGVALRRLHYAPFFLGFGHEVVVEEGCRFYHPWQIVLEDDVRINLRGLFYGSGGIYIGRHVRIGPRTFIHSANHDIASEDSRAYFERGYDYQSVVIGENSLISADVSILPGAQLGVVVLLLVGPRFLDAVILQALAYLESRLGIVRLSQLRLER